MGQSQKLELSLLFMRLTVGLVMLMWAIDKLVRPEHALGLYKESYFLENMSHLTIYFIGVLELVLIFMFLMGFLKRYTYGAVLILHGISTLASTRQYLSAFEGSNLAFFAAWPMLAGALCLFWLRGRDNIWAVEKGEGMKITLYDERKAHGS